MVTIGCFGDAEIDHFGDRSAVGDRDHDVRRFDVAVDDALLVGVLDGVADARNEFEAVVRR